MAHSHSHHDSENYFLDQIFTIALCGALGAIAVLMYVRKGMLTIILDQRFHPYVLLGGIGLLVMVLIRAVAVWKMAGQTAPAHAHDRDHHHDDHDHHHHHHEHGHDHDREHACCGHDHAHPHEHAHAHDHGHEHGWSPWRYTVLMLPVVLYFLNLPNEGFSAHYRDLAAEYTPDKKILTSLGLFASPLAPAPLLGVSVLAEDDVIEGLRFSELERAAFDPSRRSLYEGKLATLEGMFVASPDRNSFQITRYKMNCCAADALPIQAIIMVDHNWTGEPLDVKARDKKWVRVKGRIYFFRKPNSVNEFVSALIVVPDEHNPPNKLMPVIKQPGNPYAD